MSERASDRRRAPGKLVWVARSIFPASGGVVEPTACVFPPTRAVSQSQPKKGQQAGRQPRETGCFLPFSAKTVVGTGGHPFFARTRVGCVRRGRWGVKGRTSSSPQALPLPLLNSIFLRGSKPSPVADSYCRWSCKYGCSDRKWTLDAHFLTSPISRFSHSGFSPSRATFICIPRWTNGRKRE